VTSGCFSLIWMLKWLSHRNGFSHHAYAILPRALGVFFSDVEVQLASVAGMVLHTHHDPPARLPRRGTPQRYLPPRAIMARRHPAVIPPGETKKRGMARTHQHLPYQLLPYRGSPARSRQNPNLATEITKSLTPVTLPLPRARIEANPAEASGRCGPRRGSSH